MYIAQTNVQLYNQLLEQGRTSSEVAIVRKCYELTQRLYSGHYQADGTPFVAHSCGVASVVAGLGLSAETVGAACIHNIYGNGDFGDGRKNSTSPRRRQIVREAVGQQIEGYAFRFRELLRSPNHAILDLQTRLNHLDEVDCLLMVVDLADTLEKCGNLGPLYYGNGSWVIRFVADHGSRLVAMAGQLGYPQLGEALAEAFEAVQAKSIPDSLRSTETRRKYMELSVPPSCTLRTGIVLRRKLMNARKWVRRRALFSESKADG